MSMRQITRDNFAQTVDSTLAQCRLELERALAEGGNSPLINDLRLAATALELIQSEMRGPQERPKSERSAMFTRYVVDEEPGMVMDPELRDRIVQIEGFYSRWL